MGMKKKMLSATLCAVMVGSLAAPAFTVQAADDTLVTGQCGKLQSHRDR